MLDKSAVYIVSIILFQAIVLIVLFQSLFISTAIEYMANSVLTIVPYMSYIVITLTIITVVTVSKMSQLARKKHELEIQEIENRHVLELNQTLRGQRHDFNNHLQVISMLAKDNRLEAVVGYLGDLTDEAVGMNSILGIRSPVVGALISAKISRAERLGIELTYDVQGDIEGGMVKPLHLSRILGNLLDNAIEAVEEGKALPKRVDLRMYCDDAKIYISVKNPGQIGHRVMDRLFAPGVSTKKGNNRGMGLNIVKSIVDMYNGRIEVSSDAKKGVRMLVELPR